MQALLPRQPSEVTVTFFYNSHKKGIFVTVTTRCLKLQLEITITSYSF